MLIILICLPGADKSNGLRVSIEFALSQVLFIRELFANFQYVNSEKMSGDFFTMI